MNDRECDGADCCRVEAHSIDDPDHKPTHDVQVEVHGGGESPPGPVKWRSFRIPLQGADRLAFLEARRVELQEMCERRSRELIAANERIAHLERCLGRLVAERENHGG